MFISRPKPIPIISNQRDSPYWEKGGGWWKVSISTGLWFRRPLFVSNTKSESQKVWRAKMSSYSLKAQVFSAAIAACRRDNLRWYHSVSIWPVSGPCHHNDQQDGHGKARHTHRSFSKVKEMMLIFYFQCAKSTRRVRPPHRKPSKHFQTTQEEVTVGD